MRVIGLAGCSDHLESPVVRNTAATAHQSRAFALLEVHVPLHLAAK